MTTRGSRRPGREQEKVNFALIYFNVSQAYLAMGKNDLAMENLEIATQYQKVSQNLNNLFRIRLMI